MNEPMPPDSTTWSSVCFAMPELSPNVSQTAGEMPTLISLVDAGMGLSILPASAVRHSVASVVACEIADAIPMSEIGIAVSKNNRTAVVDTFRSFALNKLVRPK